MRSSYWKLYIFSGLKIAVLLIFSIFTDWQNASAQNYDVNKVGIVIDPGNKQNITGYVQIATAWGEQLSPPFDLQRGIINLKEAMNRYTKIETRMDNHLLLSSARMLKMPFIFITTKDKFELTETEKANIKKYFDYGGFMLVDNAEPRGDHSRSGASLKQLLRDTIPNARFAPIPNSHPLYHCFFDFDDGPPNGAEIGLFGGDSDFSRRLISKRIYSLEGVWYKNRLVAVYSDKGYIIKWNDNSNNEPQLKIGVNFIVFALTQKGGIANKY